MTDRDRLIELIEQAEKQEAFDFLTADLEEQIDMSGGKKIGCSLEYLAYYLSEKGVIVPPCPIGTKIYMLVTKRAKLNLPPFTFIKDSKLTFNNLERVIEDFGKTVFLTRKEAERALKERKNNVD